MSNTFNRQYITIELGTFTHEKKEIEYNLNIATHTIESSGKINPMLTWEEARLVNLRKTSKDLKEVLSNLMKVDTPTMIGLVYDEGYPYRKVERANSDKLKSAIEDFNMHINWNRAMYALEHDQEYTSKFSVQWFPKEVDRWGKRDYVIAGIHNEIV